MNNLADQEAIRQQLEAGFPQFEKALKEEIIQKGTLVQFPAGQELMHPGQYIRSTLLIAEGHVKLYREQEESEFFVYQLDPGMACALSMICAAKQEKSNLLAKTVDDVTAIILPITVMDNWMQQYKSWYYFVLDTYRKRFEEILEVVDNIAFKSMDERLEFYLRREVQHSQSNTLDITHQQIASDLNSSREVISRLLKKMEQQGKLSLGRNQILMRAAG